MQRIKAESLRRLLGALVEKVGLPEDAGKILVQGLVETSLRGVDSHGVRLMPHYIAAVQKGRVNPRPRFRFQRTGPSTGRLEADHGFGIVAGRAAMSHAITLARRSGVGVVAVANSSHFGAAAIYALAAAREGMIGLACTHSDALVFPHAGRKVFLGTNPVCFAAPCTGHPFCLDMATSAISWNKLRQHRATATTLQDGWAGDARGRECRDPAKAAGLLPAAGYKGYGLALMVEIFSSVLTGMPAGPKISRMFPVDGQRRRLGHVVAAVEVDRFVPLNTFKRNLAALLNALRAVPAVGREKVRVAGDPENEARRQRTKQGIPLDLAEIAALRETAEKLGVDTKGFRWLR